MADESDFSKLWRSAYRLLDEIGRPIAEDPEANNHRIEILEKIIGVLDKAMKYSPTNPEFFYFRAQMYQSLGRYEEARINYDEAVDQLGIRKILADEEEVLRMIREARGGTTGYRFPEILDRRAQVLIVLGKAEEALQDLDMILRIEDNFMFHVTRGFALNKLGRYGEAVTALDESVELYDNPRIHSLLGDAYSGIGQKGKAIEHYEHAIELYEGDEWQGAGESYIPVVRAQRGLHSLGVKFEKDYERRGLEMNLINPEYLKALE
ncbi:MAG: tetratricopeptide repeat protein [Nanoarchaeota archaeon]|nr:tetratricopeptide repeat protein [Nanoarchaeota archaeon]